MGFFDHLISLDKDLFLYLNGFHNTFFDYLMTIFTSEIIWGPFYITTLVIIAKKYGKKSILIFISIGILILCSDQFAGVLKHSIQRLRPSHDPELSLITHIFFNKGGLYSFVSAHSANAFAFATFTILLFKNNVYTIFIIPWAILVAYTRIYLGLHYPGDIIGGMILGVLLGIGIFKLMIFTESKLSTINKISKKSLSYREVNIIIVSGLSLIIISIIIVQILVNRDLVIIP